jgi:hypothetical protein
MEHTAQNPQHCSAFLIQTEKRLWHQAPLWFHVCVHLCDPAGCPFLLPLSKNANIELVTGVSATPCMVPGFETLVMR